jgi:arabinogalactan oligomer/maltooligosaccharide transport system substrate-binding protein
MDTRLQKLILILILLGSTFTAIQAVKADDCITDGLTVCFVAHKNEFMIEAHAKLSILVPNEAYGQAVVTYWDWYHPDRSGIVTYEVMSETAGSQDVLFINQNQAGALHSKLYPLSDVLTKNVDLNKVYALNADQLTYLPVTAEGFAFVVNKTRLELLGLSIDDLNKDGLIDSVDSFEKIFALKPLWESLDVNILPISLNEPYSFYPFLTAGGFSLYSSYDALKPGFDSESFKTGISFISALSDINWLNTETNTSDNYTWKLDDVMVNDSFIFTLAGPWMSIGTADHEAVSDWVVSKFPTYHKQELSPMVKTNGFAVNAETEYPSAAHELIRILKSIKGIQILIDNTDYIPLVNDEMLKYLTFEESHDQELAKAYQSSVGEPVIAFPLNPKHLAMELVYHMKMMDIMRALWDKTITVDEAQAQIIIEADRVIGELNVQEALPQ